MSLLRRAGILAASLIAGAAPASASLVTEMDTATLVRLSPVIVRGEVESIVSRSDAAYADIHTDVTVRVVESLRGAAGQPRVEVKLLGGSIDGHQSFVFGVPQFRQGERVLLFLRPTKIGPLTVTGLYQGKLTIESEGGVDVAIKERAAGAHAVPRGVAAHEPDRRPLAGLLDEVRDLIKRGPAAAPTPSAVKSTVAPAPAAATSASLGFTLRPLIPLRWFEPDSGLPVTMAFNPAGAPSVVPGGARAQFVAATANWTNVTGSTIVLRDGGDTSAGCLLTDGINTVSHGDPCGQLPDFDPISCAGVLAITGVANFSLESKVVNGTSFLRFREEDIVINSGTECFFADPGNYGEVVAHEMGHVIGLGHSCGDTYSPDCATDPLADAALMNAFAHGDGRGPTPQAGDINGARKIYPPPGFVDAKLNGTSFVSGQTLQLTADFNGTSRADIYVALVAPNGTFYSIGTAAPPNVLAPAALNVPLGLFVNVPLFTYTFAGTEARGTYTWYVILVAPGANAAQAANWLGVDAVVFTVA